MDKRRISDDVVATAALKLMGYSWVSRDYSSGAMVYVINTPKREVLHWVLPKNTSVVELYEHIKRLK